MKNTEYRLDVASHAFSFAQMILSLHGLLHQKGQFESEWMWEPGELKMIFIKDDSDIALWATWPCDSFKVSGHYREVCLPFWRGLRELVGRFSQEELNEHIQDEFPYSELDKLTEKIRFLKQQCVL